MKMRLFCLKCFSRHFWLFCQKNKQIISDPISALFEVGTSQFILGYQYDIKLLYGIGLGSNYVFESPAKTNCSLKFIEIKNHQELTLLFWHRKSKVDAKGYALVICRISIEGEEPAELAIVDKNYKI